MNLTPEQQLKLLMLLESQNQQAPKPKAKKKPTTKKTQRPLSKEEKEGYGIFWFAIIAFAVLYFFWKTR